MSAARVGEAKCRGEYPVIAQAVLGNAIHGRCRDHTAEGAWDAEPGVICDDQKDVGRLLGGHDARRPPVFRLKGIVLDCPAKLGIGRRQLLPADGGGRAGRTGCAGGLDGRPGRKRTECDTDNEDMFHGLPGVIGVSGV